METAGNMRHIRVVEHRSTKGYALFLSIVISFFVFVTTAGDHHKNITCPVQSLYQFGDSISDTVNLLRILPLGPTLPGARSPYGETFPGHPSGRYSDGRLIIDFIAEALGLPLLNPWLDESASFDNGVNFAVAGSTALNFSFYLRRGVITPPFPSLRTQLQWFKRHLNSICSTRTECSNKLSRALFFVGEIGYNDVRYSYRSGRSDREIKSYLLEVVQTVINTTRELIMAGASQVIVPGNFPLGCFPFVLSPAPTNDSSAYDNIGCYKRLNSLTTYQNNHLQISLNSVRYEFPSVVILYADFCNTFLSVLRKAPNLGFDASTLFKACCGAEGRSSPLSFGSCGSPGAPVCPKPSVYLHWDRIHLTQEAYLRMSEILIKDMRINCTKKKDAASSRKYVWRRLLAAILCENVKHNKSLSLIRRNNHLIKRDNEHRRITTNISPD